MKKASKAVKVRKYFDSYPYATAYFVATKFDTSMATVYNVRSQMKKEREAKFVEAVFKPVSISTSNTPIKDLINHPTHYTVGGIETIDFIEAKGLGYHLGNVLKYISRAGKKGTTDGIEDLKKAQWYLARAIDKNEVANPKG